jgi:hypothetical protein
MHRIVATLALVTAVASVGLTADPQTQPLRVEYRKDALSVHAGGVPLSSVLAEVSRVTGCRIVGLVEEQRDITADFDGVPVEEALRRLLGSQPFATRYRKDDLATIELVDRGKGGEPVIVYPTPARSASPDKPLTMPLAGALATRLGAPSAPITQVATVALGDPDASMRSAATQAIVAAIDANPQLRDEFIAVYGRMADEALVHMSQAMPGTSDFFEYMSQHTQSKELRDKAESVLRTLRRSDAGTASAAGQG